MSHDAWVVGDAYEAYVGRWSRLIAAAFVPWLGVRAGRRWLDVGCGTGALSAAVLSLADPADLTGVDPSEGFLCLGLRRGHGVDATFLGRGSRCRSGGSRTG